MDPFKITGPALISFSGGRTSGYMLWRIVQAHGGELPGDVVATFANTGREMPQTLDFVRDCGDRWGVDVAWLEYTDSDDAARRWRRVDYATAARNGEPFAALINRRQFLPNPVTRFCTVELKIRTMSAYARHGLGWPEFDKVIGLRADEPHRVARMRHNAVRSRETGERDVFMPLATAGITKRDVGEFWQRQNFGLALPSVNGTTPLGNCDLCFLKSAATISAIMRSMPDRAAWWIEQEATTKASKPRGALFRKDRPSYAAMLDAVRRQTEFDFGDADEINDCMCNGDQ